MKKKGALHSEDQTQSCRQWPLPGSRAKHTPEDRGIETPGMAKWASFVYMTSATSCNLAMPQFPPLWNDDNNIPPESLWGVSEL